MAIKNLKLCKKKNLNLTIKKSNKQCFPRQMHGFHLSSQQEKRGAALDATLPAPNAVVPLLPLDAPQAPAELDISGLKETPTSRWKTRTHSGDKCELFTHVHGCSSASRERPSQCSEMPLYLITKLCEIRERRTLRQVTIHRNLFPTNIYTLPVARAPLGLLWCLNLSICYQKV